MTTTTLKAELASITPEHLGSVADEHDVRAYREALASAWPVTDADEEIDRDVAERLMERVMGGEAGLVDGLDWAEAAAVARDQPA